MAEWGSDSWQGGRSTWGVSVWGVCSTRTVTASGLRTWHLLEAFLGMIPQIMEVSLQKGRVAVWLQGLTPQISLPISVSDFVCISPQFSLAWDWLSPKVRSVSTEVPLCLTP